VKGFFHALKFFGIMSHHLNNLDINTKRITLF